MNALPFCVYFVQGWGKTIILGVEMHGAPLAVSSHEILRGKSIIGSMFGGVKPKQDIPILADKYPNKVQLKSDIPSIVSPL
jgi:Zn-dependent alcohol dehydrogenase